MSSVAVFVLALGLAMDATAVAAARGLLARRVRLRDAALVALFFGGSQGLMPAIGGVVGATFASRIDRFSHWITFIVLGGLGAKMLHETLKRRDENDETTQAEGTNVFGIKVLAVLALATSIDALAAGVTLAVDRVSLAPACLVIGVVTGVLSFAGVFVGHAFGARLGQRLEVLGGVVLIGLGAKSLFDHYW
jgi:putative Mn2+ efflux pump MntP